MCVRCSPLLLWTLEPLAKCRVWFRGTAQLFLSKCVRSSCRLAALPEIRNDGIHHWSDLRGNLTFNVPVATVMHAPEIDHFRES
jgi:hypothetical protein